MKTLHIPYSIHTSRLILRCYKKSDAQALKTLIDISLDHLKPWMPRALQEPETVEKKQQRILAYIAKFDAGEEFTYGVFLKDTGELIGVGALKKLSENDSLEIGYWIGSAYIGKGYATESAQAFTRTGIEILGKESIHIYCNIENKGSARVPEKLGYTLEATMRVNAMRGEERQVKHIWKIFKEDPAYIEMKSIDIDRADEKGIPLNS